MLIIGLAAIIRFYRMSELAVFLADQASDSTAVLEIMRGNPTLLGPVSSVGGFFNGPIVYYLMLPFYLLLQADPIAGTVFQTVVQLTTLPLIFLIGKKLFNDSVGLLSAFLFSISPLMVDYSRMGFNSLPAIFFSTGIIWLFSSAEKSATIKKTVLIGLLIGFIVQMHYLAVSLLLYALLFPVLIYRQTNKMRYYVALCLGFLAGLSPYLLFELRNQFFNTKKIITYLTSSDETTRSIQYIITIWPEVTGSILGGNNIYMGTIIITFILMTIVVMYKKNAIQSIGLIFLGSIFAIVFLIGALYGGKMNLHYVIVAHTPLILLFSWSLFYALGKKRAYIASVCFLLFIINASHWNIDKPSHPSQDSLTIKDFKKTAKIIHDDKKTTYNVAMHAQGDNRAMPLRYTLNLLGEKPLSYEDYGGASTLYFLLKKSEKITDMTMWEYTSFGKSTLTKQWEINDRYFLYKLEKET